MYNWLFWLMLACAVTDWAGSWRGWGKIRWLSKPGTLVLLIAWFTLTGGWRGTLVWFGLGLVFSLLGDVLLHLPKQFFLFGMAAFFLAHASYIVGLAQDWRALDWKSILLILGIIIAYILLIRQILAGLRAHGETDFLPAILGYALVISAMLFFAVSTLFRSTWGINPAALVALGAGLFYVSDSTLAYARFVSPLPDSDLLVMVTYHLAQIFIASGALLQFSY